MITVTGATGFVGRQIMRSLTEHGSIVRAIVRDVNLLGEYKHHPLVEAVVVKDLFQTSDIQRERVVDGTDTLIHAAWYTVPGRYLDAEENLTCLSGTIELARAFVASGGRRFIGIGTCAEYSPSDILLEADSPIMPTTLYAASKVSAFHLLTTYLRKRQVEFAWCRLFYLFGEGEDERRLMPSIRRQISLGKPVELGSGDKFRDYLNVAEAGALVVRVALGSMQGPLNICSGKPITVRQVAEGIADEYGRRDLLRFGVKPDSPFDPPCLVGRREEI